MPDPPLLLDACIAINLAAAAPLDQIARSMSRTFLITRQAAGEVGHLRDTVGGETVLVPAATDDRKARRLCIERGLNEPVSTTSLVRRYCEASGLDQPSISDLLRAIISGASFLPPRSDPNVKWWNDHLDSGP